MKKKFITIYILFFILFSLNVHSVEFDVKAKTAILQDLPVSGVIIKILDLK